ncbi:unnamed protein product [Angiostrongylus costaricensis]|uniref:Transmembrane protein n=1 Tax=Angiostrongylus costaricensis TaxID=334426 RepID=A0A0R3PRM8_ANGCS|nr:unnamed protein product [Angiostrongylus costaricensis]
MHFVKLLSKANFSYGCVSFGLIATGLVFTVFAIFQKDSQIGKVWLAGPTTMVVGLVLCGKVIIDWGPAMLHAREGSIDSRLMEHYVRLHFTVLKCHHVLRDTISISGYVPHAKNSGSTAGQEKLF